VYPGIATGGSALSASSARAASTSTSERAAAATNRISRRLHRRRAVATWSFLLRPVCRREPGSPAIWVTRRSMAVWMSSSVSANTNVPPAISAWTVSSAAATVAASSTDMSPTWASISTCALEPSMSSAHNLRSKPMLSVKSIRSRLGPEANLPCHSAAPPATSPPAGPPPWVVSSATAAHLLLGGLCARLRA
jgi:hypothetical protein